MVVELVMVAEGREEAMAAAGKGAGTVRAVRAVVRVRVAEEVGMAAVRVVVAEEMGMAAVVRAVARVV